MGHRCSVCPASSWCRALPRQALRRESDASAGDGHESSEIDRAPSDPNGLCRPPWYRDLRLQPASLLRVWLRFSVHLEVRQYDVRQLQGEGLQVADRRVLRRLQRWLWRLLGLWWCRWRAPRSCSACPSRGTRRRESSIGLRRTVKVRYVQALWPRQNLAAIAGQAPSCCIAAIAAPRGTSCTTPALSDPTRDDAVLCVGSPFEHRVIRLRVSGRMNRSFSARIGVVWAVRLANGLECTFFAGGATNADREGRRLNYGCRNSSSVLWGNPIRQGRTWHIRLTHSSQPGPERLVVIRTAFIGRNQS